MIKIMYKYAHLKRFHCDHRLQVHMFSFTYVYPKTMPVEDPFPDTKSLVENYNKMSTPGPVPKHCLGFSYIHSKYYELDHSFDK